MATVVRLTEAQITHLFDEMLEIEGELKALYDDLADLHVPDDMLRRFRRLHDRYSEAANFLQRQRDLGSTEGS